MDNFKNINKHKEHLTTKPPKTHSRLKTITAIIIAIIADILSIFLSFAPEIAIPVNMILVGILSLLLGFKFIYIPSALVETFPLISAMPFWTAATLYSIYKNKHPKLDK
ncbi:hypothetical protein PQO03_09820 [Lentisphaera profundi]|uniref:Holin n=1 Tax=Lentisphaera profundi TaxID=1658616 RepID=A0ABY7VS17_9BACT|nr:hypothetical protein [Lentisphaera profundi]WDE96010.1 hypothetical protein PQO03_09820 [Lentisphaera profundi]